LASAILPTSTIYTSAVRIVTGVVCVSWCTSAAFFERFHSSMFYLLLLRQRYAGTSAEVLHNFGKGLYNFGEEFNCEWWMVPFDRLRVTKWMVNGELASLRSPSARVWIVNCALRQAQDDKVNCELRFMSWNNFKPL
jgi:hypothetical protein